MNIFRCCICKRSKKKEKKNNIPGGKEEKENEFPSIKEKDIKSPISLDEKEIPLIEEGENEIPEAKQFIEEIENQIPETIPSEIGINDEFNEPPPLNYVDQNCYMNSIMQALGSCEKLREDLKILAEEYHCEKLMLFIDLLEALNSFEAQDQFCKFMSQHGWNKDGQQDSYEMMAFLINSIYNELKEEEVKKFDGLTKKEFNNMWKEKTLPCRLKMYSKTICGCETKKKNIQNDLSLHLPLGGPQLYRQSLRGIIYKFKDMMEAVFKEDIVEDGCEDCNKDKSLRLDIDGDPPKTLCLHIQANKYNEETGEIIKPKYNMDFPFNLELKSKNYEIMSFVEHIGGVLNGHYISYRRFKDKWFLVDDQHVSLLPMTCKSSDLSLKPYVLFYEVCD